MGVGRLEKTIEKREIEGKSTKVAVNTSTCCHQFSLLLPVSLAEEGRRTDKRSFNENTTAVKLLSSLAECVLVNKLALTHCVSRHFPFPQL